VGWVLINAVTGQLISMSGYLTNRELADSSENIHSARSEQDNNHERNQRLDHHTELCPA
jgi:hypothetical protein